MTVFVAVNENVVLTSVEVKVTEILGISIDNSLFLQDMVDVSFVGKDVIPDDDGVGNFY